MALEAFGAASNAAGLVSLGLTVCHGLLKYYESWKDAENDMKKMYESIQTLTKTFTVLRDTLTNPSLKLSSVKRIEENVRMCEDGIGCLYKKLNKIHMTTQKTTASWDVKMRQRLQRALYPFKESTLVKLKEVSNGLIENLRLALEILQLDTSAMSLQALYDQAGIISDVSADLHLLMVEASHNSSGINLLTSAHENSRLSEIFDWLSPLYEDFVTKQCETFNIAARQDVNSLWLINSTDFKQWIRCQGQLLWCIGSKGIGKTVLASFIINHLQTARPKASGIAYIYGNYNDSRKQSVENLIGVVLQQLSTQNDRCMDELRQCHENHHKARTRPSLVEYCKLLQTVASYFSNVFVVIDGLDEYDEDTRDTLLEQFGALRPDFSLLITSRHTTLSTPWTDSERKLTVTASENDIRGYLEERLRQCKVLRPHIAKDSGLHKNIVSSIVRKANGMFLLARLQLDSLMAKPTLRKIKSALGALPEELDAVYDQALGRVRAQDPEYAALGWKIICWVHLAAKALTLQEIRHAVAIEVDDAVFDEEGLPDEDLLETVCAGLIVVQDKRTVELVHYTAQEYLSRKSSSLFSNGNAMIAEICLTYLLFEDFSGGPSLNDNNMEKRYDQFPLLTYAAQYWAFHFQDTYPTTQNLERKVLSFLDQKPNVEASTQAMLVKRSRIANWSQEYTKGIGSLGLSSMHGLQHVCKRLVEQGSDVDSSDSCGYTPLHYASLHGFEGIVQLLLDRSADLEMKTTYHGRTALHWAALHGHQNAVQQLLLKGAEVAARDRRGWSALHLAASGGHHKILRILLNSGSDVNWVDGYGATALYRAADAGHEDATIFLLENHAEPNILNDYQQTALHRAADLGYFGVTRSLLNHGADHRLKDYYGWTPLYRAADHGHDDVAELLADFAQ